MVERLGSDADGVSRILSGKKFPRHLIDEAIRMSQRKGFTIFSMVDALTKLSQTMSFAAERTKLDFKISQLLSLAV